MAGNSSYTFDRIGRGLHLHIEGLCLSMLGSTQPGRISQYLSRAVRGGRGDDGLIQRFGLLVWPDVSSRWANVDRWPDKDARTVAFKVFEDFVGLDWHTIAATRDRGADGDETGCHISGSQVLQVSALSNGALIGKSGCAAAICPLRWNRI